MPYWPAVLCPRPATLQHFPSHHARDMGCPPTPALPRLPFSLLPILRFALHRPAPSRAPGRSRAMRSLPVRLGPTRSTGTLASLHRPAPPLVRAGLGLCCLSLSGSGRLGAPVPSLLYIARHPLWSGPVTGHAASPCPARADSEYRYPPGSCRLGILPQSHPCSARADSDCRRIFALG